MQRKYDCNIKNIISKENKKEIEKYLRGYEKISRDDTYLFIEEPVKIFDKVMIPMAEALIIGAYSYIMSARIRVKTYIGRYVSIATDVVIGEPNHPITWFSTSPIQYNYKEKWGWHHSLSGFVQQEIPKKDHAKIFGKRVEIGNDVWIGADVTILRGVKIADGAIIAAGSVVTKHVPPYAIVGGAPAKVIRYRFNEELRENFLRLQWWKYHPDVFSGLNFSDPLSVIKKIEEKANCGDVKILKNEYVMIKP